MILQKILKGIAGIDEATAKDMFDSVGIQSNWWRGVRTLPANQIPDRLTEDNIIRHLSGYDDIDQATGRPFGELTPFISTTAGGVERHADSATNLRFSAFLTALAFATKNYTTDGAIFYGYVNVLGKKSIKLEEFAEETRELNIWTEYQPYHREGEIVAKIAISPAHLEKAEGYHGPTALAALRLNTIPQPAWTAPNTKRYVPPEDICNVRDFLI